MITNTTIKEIAGKLLGANSVLLFPHIDADGDAIGSCVAICLALRQLGIPSWIIVEEPVTDYVSFVDKGCCTQDITVISDPDICMAVDMSESYRLAGREDAYYAGRMKLCIDHHINEKGLGDLYYIDETEAATCQIAYVLLREMQQIAADSGKSIELDIDICDALYTGISTDTGNYKYRNTTPKTHRIAAELMEMGVDHGEIMARLHMNIDKREALLRAHTLLGAKFHCGGSVAVGRIGIDTLEKFDTSYEKGDGAIDTLRDIDGVVVAAILREKSPGAVKVSLRSKGAESVDDIAALFGGGGHAKAAGCTIYGSVEQAENELTRELVRKFGQKS